MIALALWAYLFVCAFFFAPFIAAGRSDRMAEQQLHSDRQRLAERYWSAPGEIITNHEHGGTQ